MDIPDSVLEKLKPLRLAARHAKPFITFSVAEFIDYVVDPEHREAVKAVQGIVDANQYSRRSVYSSFGQYTVTWIIRSETTILPKELCFKSDVPVEVTMKITKWLDYQYKVSLDYSLVIAAVTELAETCTSLKQMRFLWPPLVALLDEDEKEAASKPVRIAPAIYPELRQMLRDASRIVSSAMLLDSNLRTTDVIYNNDITLWNCARSLVPAPGAPLEISQVPSWEISQAW